MNRNFIRHIQTYVARYSVSASAVRGQSAPGLVATARTYLASVPLRRFAVESHSRFLRNLDTHTEQLRVALPRGAHACGVARKVLNIFLRNALYTGYLRDQYHLDVAEDWYEIPLDSIVAERLREASPDGELPRWLGVKHLTPSTSALYQSVARTTATRLGVARVHMDAVWWGGARPPAA
jgi:hypothetical protein